MQFSFQSAMNGAAQSAPSMLRRVFAHNLFLKTNPEQIEASTGKSHRWTCRIIRATHMIAPWFLIVSLALLIPVMGWLSILFIPLFIVGYFLFAFQSVKNGGMVLPTIIVISANALPWIPEVNPALGAFLATFSMALWCNRFNWWFADYSLSRNPALGQLFRGGQAPQQESSSGIEDAEVIEVTTVEPTKLN